MNYTLREIAKVVGRAPSTVHATAKKLGLDTSTRLDAVSAAKLYLSFTDGTNRAWTNAVHELASNTASLLESYAERARMTDAILMTLSAGVALGRFAKSPAVRAALAECTAAEPMPDIPAGINAKSAVAFARWAESGQTFYRNKLADAALREVVANLKN